VTTYFLAMLLALAFALPAQSAAPAEVDSEDTPRSTRTAGARLALLAGAVLAAVGALRWRVGTDYFTYAQLYPGYSTVPWQDYGFISEPGLKAIAYISRLLHDDYATMMAIASVITIGLSVRTLYRHSPAFAFSLFLFAVTGPWLGSFNGIRQYLACAIVFAGHRYAIERHFLRYAVVVGLASLFHISAVVCLMFYFLPRRRLSAWTAIAVAAAAIVATEAYGRILDVIVTIRSGADFTGPNSYFTEELNPLRVLVAVAPLIFYAVVADKKRLTPADGWYAYMLLAHAAVLVAASGSAYIARFGAYTGIFLCLAIPRLLPTKDANLRALALLAMVSLYTAFWYVETANIPELANFRWIFDRPEGQ
jgi:transmembrane protein EpsG